MASIPHISPVVTSAIAFALLAVAEWLYMILAGKFSRRLKTTHGSVTGGGFTFFPAILAGLLLGDVTGPLLGVLLICGGVLWAVSFLDDIYDLSALLRLAMQIVVATVTAFALLAAWGGSYDGFIAVMAVVLLIIVSINAFNFMDGTRGMLGLYTLVVTASLLAAPGFVEAKYMLAAAVAAFAVFNVILHDRVYAGDVGSVTAGFFIGVFIAWAVIVTGCVGYVTFIAVFLTDTGVTIAGRLRRGENLLRSHRRHLYQRLTDGGAFSHLAVAAGYAALQAVVNLGLLSVLAWWPGGEIWYTVGVFILLTALRVYSPNFMQRP